MAVSAKERKKKQRQREEVMGVKNMHMRISKVERQDIADGAKINGFDDQTEYLMRLVHANRDKSQNMNYETLEELRLALSALPAEGEAAGFQLVRRASVLQIIDRQREIQESKNGK